MAGESASVRRNVEERRLSHCRQLHVQRRLDPTRRAQSSETLDGRDGKAFIVVIEVYVLRYSAPLNHLADVNPRSHARCSIVDNPIPDRRLSLDRLAISKQTDVDEIGRDRVNRREY